MVLKVIGGCITVPVRSMETLLCPHGAMSFLEACKCTAVKG